MAGSTHVGRGGNYSAAETNCLLDVIAEFRPVSGYDWAAAEAEFSNRWPSSNRDVTSMKRRYGNLHRKKPPTGSPDCPPEVRRAKRIYQDILEGLDASDGGSGISRDGLSENLGDTGGQDKDDDGDDDDKEPDSEDEYDEPQTGFRVFCPPSPVAGLGDSLDVAGQPTGAKSSAAKSRAAVTSNKKTGDLFDGSSSSDGDRPIGQKKSIHLRDSQKCPLLREGGATNSSLLKRTSRGRRRVMSRFIRRRGREPGEGHVTRTQLPTLGRIKSQRARGKPCVLNDLELLVFLSHVISHRLARGRRLPRIVEGLLRWIMMT